MIQTYSLTKAAITQRANRMVDPEKFRAYARAHYAKHSAKCKALAKAWKSSHLSYYRALNNLENKIKYWSKKGCVSRVKQLKLEKLLLQETLQDRRTWGNFRCIECTIA